MKRGEEWIQKKGGRNTEVVSMRMLKVEIAMLKVRAGEGKSVGEYLREQIRKGIARDFNEKSRPIPSGVDTSKLSRGPHDTDR